MMMYSWRKILCGSTVILLTLLCVAYVIQYLRVSTRLDVVQASAAGMTQEMLADRDVIVVSDEGADDVIQALRALCPLVLMADTAEAAPKAVQVARAEYTVLYCADAEPGTSRSPDVDCLVTLVHPKTSASVSVIVRPMAAGGGVIVLPPHWRYAAEVGGCTVMERRLNGAVSWIASRAGG